MTVEHSSILRGLAPLLDDLYRAHYSSLGHYSFHFIGRRTPAAWSRRGDKIIFRSEDIHGTVAKLRRDVPDYLYGSGTKGNFIVFEVDELQNILGVSILSKKSPIRALKRLLGGNPQ